MHTLQTALAHFSNIHSYILIPTPPSSLQVQFINHTQSQKVIIWASFPERLAFVLVSMATERRCIVFRCEVKIVEWRFETPLKYIYALHGISAGPLYFPYSISFPLSRDGILERHFSRGFWA
jgi:hypothetical protein